MLAHLIARNIVYEVGTHELYVNNLLQQYQDILLEVLVQLELTMFCEMLATSNNKIFFCAKLDGGALEHGISTEAKMFL